MDNAGYVSLSRQSGLLKELSIIANNMANSDTTGFKREGAVFSEYITAAQTDPTGHFMTDQTGRLITPDGNAVLDVAEGEIQIPAEASLLQISKDGVLSADGVEFSRLGVVSATETDLTRLGGNNWLSEQAGLS